MITGCFCKANGLLVCLSFFFSLVKVNWTFLFICRESLIAQADGPELEERGLSIDERAREVIEYLAKRYIEEFPLIWFIHLYPMLEIVYFFWEVFLLPIFVFVFVFCLLRPRFSLKWIVFFLLKLTCVNLCKPSMCSLPFNILFYYFATLVTANLYGRLKILRPATEPSKVPNI